MKKLNLKAMVPLTLPTGIYTWLRGFTKMGKNAEFVEMITETTKFATREPGETEWGSSGFIEPFDKFHYIHDLDGAALMMMVQFNKRILPAAVRNEKLDARVKDFEAKQGREIRKDEYAKMRDDIEAELLPKAFIRRTLVPLFIFKDRVFIFSSSHATVDGVASGLARMIEALRPKLLTAPFSPLRTEKSIPATLREIAIDGFAETDAGWQYSRMRAVKLKGGDNRSVTFKDRDLAGKEVQLILSDATNYSVTELALMQSDDQTNEICSFTLTQAGAYKGIKLADGVSKTVEDHKDLHAVCWLTARTLKGTVDEMVALMGGLQQDGKPADDEDEM